MNASGPLINAPRLPTWTAAMAPRRVYSRLLLESFTTEGLGTRRMEPPDGATPH